jgi:hypothetical protein
MKMTRKLIPALVMLLVSAVMLSTASFAWFASNYNVAVNGMNVKVKSTAKFLEISKTSSSTGFDKFVDINNDLAEIELVHAKVVETTNTATLTWHTGTSEFYDQVGSTNTEALAGITAQHALINTLYVRMSKDTSTEGLKYLRIKEDSVTVTGSDNLTPALRLLVVCEDDEANVLGMQLWSNRDGSIATYNGTDDAAIYIAPDVALNEVYTVKTYLYFDGEDASAVTSNTVNLQNISVSFSLTAGPEVVTP